MFKESTPGRERWRKAVARITRIRGQKLAQKIQKME